ncbi:hypothetical protein [Scytonema sp. PRP1]|uniref:hypothetical protein n=1 Tax=Scytonema sp. PRP1 TaxID=3120513 RepID=UPI002FD2CC54
MVDTVIFLNACFTYYMPSPQLGNFLLARLLRRKGNTRLRRRFGKWYGLPATARSHIVYTSLYTMITIAKNPVLAEV